MADMLAIQDEIVAEFSSFDNWTDRYEYMIELGKSLPLIDPKYKVDDNLIKGCQSNVWLHSENNDGKLIFTADSDAILTKGIIAILIRVFSNQDPDSIMGAKIDFIDKIGLKNHLSPIRANGLLSMIKELKMYAVKSKTKSN